MLAEGAIMSVQWNSEPHAQSRSERDEPSWPAKIADVLRRIFLPGSQEPELVPVRVDVPRFPVRRRV